MADESPLDGVDVHDAGDKIIVSCKSEDRLKYVVAQFVADGAQNVTPVSKIGSKWISSFSNPAYLSCTIETFGFELIVSGPDPESVQSRARECRERGCLHVRGPELIDGVWKIYLEDVGARTGAQITM